MKQRLDSYLVEKGYFSSRNISQRSIKNGLVSINNKVIKNKNYQVKDSDEIIVKNEIVSFVSRGGHKLFHALNEFKLDVTDFVCVDIGASTGGFSDCLLKQGAKKTYAIDVGTNQLHESLKSNQSIISLEQTNFRYFDTNIINDDINLCVIDVSFISLYHIFDVLNKFKEPNLEVIALIKPQFETTSKNISKHGVVKGKTLHKEIINKVRNDALKSKFELINLTYSPIQGEKSGNIEYLGHFKRNGEPKEININKVVEEAHKNFKVK